MHIDEGKMYSDDAKMHIDEEKDPNSIFNRIKKIKKF